MLLITQHIAGKWQAAKPVLLLLLMASMGRAQCVADTVQISCGNSLIFWERQQYDTASSFALVHVHQNETTALQAAQWLLDSIRQGSLTTWKAQGQRYIGFSPGSKNYRFDPNRIYTASGIRATTSATAPDTAFALVQSVADTFLARFILGKKLVVALHNNTDGGGLSVNSYRPGGIYRNEALETYVNPMQDADDFFYTTEKPLFDFLKQHLYNAILQNNQRVTDDGSLSVFCASEGIAYINIETETGQLNRQCEMLQLLWMYIASMQDKEQYPEN